MEILLSKIVVSLLVCVLNMFCGYKIGYAKREKIFQNNPILFQEGGENAVRVYRENSGIKIKIYNEKLVQIIK